MKRHAILPVIAALVTLLTTSPSYAQYVTPSGPSAILFQPCAFELGDTADGPIAGFIWNRYSWTSIKDEYFDNYATCWIEDFDTALRGGQPWLYVNTHGGIVFQAYPPTPQGLAARDASYNDIVPRLYGNTIVVRQTMWEDAAQTIPRMYVILTVEGFVRTRYQGSRINNINRSVVHFAGCDAWNFRSAFRSPNSGKPAADFLSYDYEVTNGVVESDGNTIYARMSGENGVTADTTYRPLHKAIQGLTIRIDPTTISASAPDVVLSPRVRRTSLAQGADFTAAQTLVFDFDAPMNTSQNMASVIRCEGDVKFDDNSLVWTNGGLKLQGTIRGLVKDGYGTAVLMSYDRDNFDLDGMMSDTGIGMDGNTAPAGNEIGGQLEAGDDFRLRLRPRYADNAAALVSGLTAEREHGGVSVRWVVESENNTASYIVEHAPRPTDAFVPVTEIIADGASVYQTMLTGYTSGFCRLREVETDGDTLVQAYASITDPQPVESDFVDEAAAADLQRLLEATYATAAPDALTATVYTDVIFTPTVFQPQANTLASFKTGRGIPTTVVLLENIGGAAGIKPTIAAMVPQGARNFLLFGDANDDRDVQGFQVWNNSAVWDSGYVKPGGSSAQPLNNVIPVGQYRVVPGLQSISMPVWQKVIASDWWYIDLDGDGLPDPGLTIGRLPAAGPSAAALMTNAVNKQINAWQISPSSPGVNHVFKFTYAFDVYGNSGSDAIAISNRINGYLPPGVVLDNFVDKPTAWYSNASRDSLCTAQFNKGSALHIYKGTVNNRYHNAGCLDQDRRASLSGLVSNPTRLAFLYVSGCGGADFERTELDSVGRPLNERLLGNRSDLGCWGYFGQSRGTWQSGLAVLDSLFLTRLYSQGAQSTGQAAALAVYMLATHFPQYRDLAISCVFVGDPSIPLPWMHQVNVGVEEPMTERGLHLNAPRPNPIHGRATLNFSLPRAAHATLNIVDVAGRLVATVVDHDLPAGAYSTTWDGTGRSGTMIRGGVYFAHLRVGSESRVQKMVVLR